MHFQFAASDGARTIYDNLRVGAPSTDFRAVKEALERAYAAIGVSCADVGGLWDGASGGYYADAEPCVDADQPGESTGQQDVSPTTWFWDPIRQNIFFFMELCRGFMFISLTQARRRRLRLQPASLLFQPIPFRKRYVWMSLRNRSICQLIAHSVRCMNTSLLT